MLESPFIYSTTSHRSARVLPLLHESVRKISNMFSSCWNYNWSRAALRCLQWSSPSMLVTEQTQQYSMWTFALISPTVLQTWEWITWIMLVRPTEHRSSSWFQPRLRSVLCWSELITALFSRETSALHKCFKFSLNRHCGFSTGMLHTCEFSGVLYLYLSIWAYFYWASFKFVSWFIYFSDISLIAEPICSSRPTLFIILLILYQPKYENSNHNKHTALHQKTSAWKQCTCWK